MKKILTRIALLFASTPLLVVAPVGASSLSYFTDFDSQQPELFYEVFEGGAHYPGVACGTDACTTFERQGNRTFGRFTVNPSATPGFYQNAATSQVPEPGDADQGPYSLTNGHSITMEAKVKWSAVYNADGSGSAEGTSGLVFWNGALGEFGQTPEYDQIGFTWASQDVLFGSISGFMANSFVDLFPEGMSSPVSPIDIHGWIKVKMIWAQDSQGVQSVTYIADGQNLGTHVLSSQLHGLSLEIWNDNQEPNFCEEGICNNFPNPSQSQSFYVDYVKITQQ